MVHTWYIHWSTGDMYRERFFTFYIYQMNIIAADSDSYQAISHGLGLQLYLIAIAI